MKLISTILFAIIVSFVVIISQAHSEQSIEYPNDYRHWTHIKSMVIQEGHPLHTAFGGIHHIYANQEALIGYQTGKFPEGSIIAFDLLEVSDQDNAITETHRKVLGVMLKNTKAFSDTSGWGFEGFGAGDPNNPVIGSNYKNACYECHTSQQDADYVFSKWRD